MKNEWITKLEMFYDLTEEQQQETLKSILTMANTDPENFQQVIRSKEFNEMDYLPIIYEALSKDLGKWADFFLAEIKRLLDEAKRSETPKKILHLLDEFSFINPDAFQYRNEFVEILKKELDNKQPVFRYYAISLLPDFIKENDYGAINKLKGLLTDPNWRIRYWAYLALNDLNKLDSRNKLSLADKVRVKFLDTLKFE